MNHFERIAVDRPRVRLAILAGVALALGVYVCVVLVGSYDRRFAGATLALALVVGAAGARLAHRADTAIAARPTSRSARRARLLGDAAPVAAGVAVVVAAPVAGVIVASIAAFLLGFLVVAARSYPLERFRRRRGDDA